MTDTEQKQTTDTKLNRISVLSKANPKEKFNNLMHLFNEESLTQCFHELDGKKAVGIDLITKEEYGRSLESNIKQLVQSMKNMAYKPGPVRQVMIPKPGKPGATRPLGIANLEDKIVQSMMRKVLEAIYEPLFLECSYGFRPNKGCHDAVRAMREFLFKNDTEIIIDIDLENYFGTIRHDILESLLREKITDRKMMRYIIRMFKAGVLSEGEMIFSEEGVPQGSICSPVLSNIMAHYVIDTWVEDTVKRHCRGKISMYRYADDLCLCCEYKYDADRVKSALKKRLEKFGLKMNEDKTKLKQFSKRKARPASKQESFDFLGFTFYLGKSQRGFYVPKVKTSKKRFNCKLKGINDWMKRSRNLLPMKELWETFCRKMEGHHNYYGTNFNTGNTKRFQMQATRIMFKWLNRRSQRRSMSWGKFNLFMKKFPPPKPYVRVKI